MYERIVDIHWDFSDEEAIVKEWLEKGGSLIVYSKVTTAPFNATFRSYKLKRISDNKNRTLLGLPFIFWTLIFGWWSICGFYITIGAIIWNTRGGLEVTKHFKNNPNLSTRVEMDIHHNKIEVNHFSNLVLLLLACMGVIYLGIKYF